MAGALNTALDAPSTAMSRIDSNPQTLSAASKELSATSAQMSRAAQNSASQATDRLRGRRAGLG